MSEQILKALMQLFAIIARPHSNRHDRRVVVENFLKRQLNAELVQEYLTVFEEYYEMHQTKLSEKNRSDKRTSASSVRLLVICAELNEELTQKQKVIVLIQFLEFINSDIRPLEGLTEQELVFISTVSDSFKIPTDEFSLIRDFVLYPSDHIQSTNKVIIINNLKGFQMDGIRHIYSDGLEGQVHVLHVAIANLFLVRYIGESEIYLNGQLLPYDKVQVFNTGSSIRNPQIKPIYFSDVVSFFHDGMDGSKIILEVKDIEYRFKGGKVGLQQMNFTEESGRLVGIMGASGAGKSTLLNVLNGSSKPSCGEILVNGINIHTQKKETEGIIGYVSQDDLLIEDLTVFENLYYNAKLCFDNVSDTKIRDIVSDMLNSLGLFDIKDMKVGSPLNKKISGGQRKRLNIALELIREPSILFLDEPTSGLSSRDSENIMDLLKELTFKGKLVFVVIHQPSSDIFKMFDKLLILDSGGYLIYNGDPIESIIYFKSRMHHANWNESECHICGNVNPEQVFNIVESRVLDEYGKITLTRKVSPKEWNQHFLNYMSTRPKNKQHIYDVPPVHFKIPSLFKQFLVFIKRDILSKLANTQYLIINLLEAPLLAFILSYLIKYFNVANIEGYTLNGNSNLPVYIFMSVIVAIFVGLSVSAEEIIKDRKILKREAFLNLSWSSYLMSKIAVLFSISAVQALAFVLVGNSIIEVKGMYFEYWIVLFTAWAGSNVVGLVISDSFKTVVTIYILIPFLVIPQIILSGVIVKYDKLNPALSTPNKVPFYGEIITARWAYEALAVQQFMRNDYEKLLYPFEKTMSLAHYKKDFWFRNLKNKVDYISQQLPQPEDKSLLRSNLEVLHNEIAKENSSNKLLKYAQVDQITEKNINAETLTQLDSHLEKLNKYYIRLYNKANDQRDEIISSLQQNPKQKELFLKLKMSYHNEKLTEFVTNSNEVDKIVEYDGELFQKADPIYLDPDSKLIKAHFYAPQKQLFGKFYSTLWINILFIWFTIGLLYAALYFRVIKNLFDKIEQIADKFSKQHGS